MTISDYVQSGDWIKLYHGKMNSHVTGFFYNLFRWLEESGADTLELRDEEFIWRKNGTVVGHFPITTPSPDPSFQDTLLFILNADKVIGNVLYSISETNLIFRFVANH